MDLNHGQNYTLDLTDILDYFYSFVIYIQKETVIGEGY